MTILFDLDGTLIDSTEAIVESFYSACEKYNFKKPSQEEITSLIGYPLDVMFRSIGVEEEKVWDFVSAYKETYREISKEKTTLLPKAKETIQNAATFARLGVVTTKTGRYSKELLEHFGIMCYFETLIGREDVTHPKPHPEPVLKALLAMQITKKDDVFLIGDTKLDLLSAKAAGIQAVGVLCGYGKEEELKKYDFELTKDAFLAVEMLKKEKKSHTDT
jgi:phosphoglycolate phosphatase